MVLAEGDRAEIVGSLPYQNGNYAPAHLENGKLAITVGNVDFDVSIFESTVGSGNGIATKVLSKIVLTGPAVIKLHSGGNSFVTFEIHRAWEPSNAVPIPQEAGANFNVILEQSSDLLNWTPANPGTYTGTEVKRFFRTRIVRLTQ